MILVIIRCNGGRGGILNQGLEMALLICLALQTGRQDHCPGIGQTIPRVGQGCCFALLRPGTKGCQAYSYIDLVKTLWKDERILPIA